MKILHLSNVLNAKTGGGVHEVVVNLYNSQKLSGHQPHIMYPDKVNDLEALDIEDNIHALPTFGVNEFQIIKDIFKSIPKNFNDYEIIHQHGIWTTLSIYSLKVSKKYNIKTVIQPHGYLEPYRLNISKLKKKISYSLYERYNIDNSSALIACSESEGSHLKNRFPYKDIAVIPNGISDDFINTTVLMSPFKKEKRRLLFISQIIPIKGLERLFKIIHHIGTEKFNYYELIISGYGPITYISYLQKLLNDLKLSDFITFIGPKYGDEKIHLFDTADFFVFPSYNENFGLVIAEALARKIPVLATKGTPWEDLLTHKCGFWVDNTDDGIAEGLLQIIQTTDEEQKIMGENGINLINSKYIWHNSAIKTIQLYQWLITGNNKPSFII